MQSTTEHQPGSGDKLSERVPAKLPTAGRAESNKAWKHSVMVREALRAVHFPRYMDRTAMKDLRDGIDPIPGTG